MSRLDTPPLAGPGGPVVVIGAGIGGLTAGLTLAAAGRDVTLVDPAAAPGGKMRRIDGVEAGPTVLTMRWVFDALFEAAGAGLEDRLTLVRQDILARHFWPDGSRLDLHADPDASAAAIRAFAGARAEADFRAFSARAARLHDAFLDPVMRASAPDPRALARRFLSDPGLLPAMAPGRSLAGLARKSFFDPRLAQLFARYATYVGGDPGRTPALLSLVWHAEAAGVWAIAEGMSGLAAEIARLIGENGGRVILGRSATAILSDSDGVTGVRLDNGRILPAGSVVFNGDPRALADGALGPDARSAAPAAARAPRSLSARVWSFRARWDGPGLVHHNVFFRGDPAPEFADIARGRPAPDPTLYVCAEDRGTGRDPDATERFEIIVNAPPLAQNTAAEEEFEACLTRTFGMLARFGARVSPMPEPRALTTPRDFAARFPGSAGSLYGPSPHGMMAAFRRPTARSRMRGLYLAGGGVHPGAGVPMAALSGRHAAAAILTDHASRSPSRPTAMPGGMSTGSATMANAPSRSSPS
ncbi:Hydroxyneurosporene desaturase [Roseivivax jejudonensis]|uniref:Hydroxyneurosporene desaturase n=1 Tax=Roseivivax jejudonensis TaxID=1529041 RepID=A0A1X6ZNX5_9RHOB|nr:1-hydroxycarotenoid 3,4-desaturase CrtD [Roseivivax jejudonensis]SLN57199.1 Hydroxyneurosporene desaturase [Roseivivax jejudonensis]